MNISTFTLMNGGWPVPKATGWVAVRFGSESLCALASPCADTVQCNKPVGPNRSSFCLTFEEGEAFDSVVGIIPAGTNHLNLNS